MFYPRLTRKDEHDYHSNRGAFYADYKANHDNISIDCQHRCVYCDVLVEEVGGEGMHLDHFRPQNYFPELSIHPYNLVLSCPKCNYLKSDDWPAEKVDSGPSFINNVGYIDSFGDDPGKYFSTEKCGKLIVLGGPAEYVIQRLQLNRLSRVQIRRRRIIREEKRLLSSEITNKLKLILKNLKGGGDSTEAAKSLEYVIQLKERLDSLDI